MLYEASLQQYNGEASDERDSLLNSIELAVGTQHGLPIHEDGSRHKEVDAAWIVTMSTNCVVWFFLCSLVIIVF